MRGKEGEDYESQADDRITPAYAGKSSIIRHVWNKEIGSPPPMRGKGCRSDLQIWSHRITPAYAGKRSGTGFLQEWQRDHPRLCGEKSYETSRFLRQIGSPPPMRGKAGTDHRKFMRFRITPAYAGKSDSKAF